MVMKVTKCNGDKIFLCVCFFMLKMKMRINVWPGCERFVLKSCCAKTDNSMHIAVHPANNKGDDDDVSDDKDYDNEDGE